MRFKEAIIDTSVLISLYQLNLLDKLILFYNKVRIPRAVEFEFLNKHKCQKECFNRAIFLTEFYTQNQWLIPCNDYSSDIVSIYLTDKELDEGEAEVLAQNQAYSSSHELLLDERKARSIANDEKIKLHGVLFFLAKLDLKYKACNYFDSVNVLINKYGSRFSNKIVSEVYRIEKE